MIQKPLLEVKDLCLIRDGIPILDHITLEIFRGSFYTILGESGCGKTTFLRALAGFEKPTSGQILLNGIDITYLSPSERSINLIFQSYALFPHLTVQENVEFGILDMPTEIIRERSSHALNAVEMNNFINKYPHQLSGGQKQRIAIARALCKRPALLLLDEPFAALDKSLQQRTQLELVDLQEKLGMTFLMVTHDQEQALTVSSKIAVFAYGKPVQIGTPHEIYEFPKGSLAAKSVGEISIITGIIKSQKKDYLLVYCQGLDQTLEIKHQGQIDINTLVYIAIRPEKVQISKIQETKIKGVINDIEYLGDMSIYHVQILNSQQIIKSSIIHNKRTKHDFTWNEKVFLHWESEDAFIISE